MSRCPDNDGTSCFLIPLRHGASAFTKRVFPPLLTRVSTLLNGPPKRLRPERISGWRTTTHPLAHPGYSTRSKELAESWVLILSVSLFSANISLLRRLLLLLVFLLGVIVWVTGIVFFSECVTIHVILSSIYFCLLLDTKVR